MAYSNDGRRSGVPRRSQGRVGESRGSQGSVTSQGSRPARARGGSASQYRSSRGFASFNGRQTKLNSRANGLRLDGRRHGLLNEASRNPRMLLALVTSVVLIVICAFGITNLVRSCVAERQAETPANQLDSRVAGGISDEMTDLFTTALDRGDDLETIAAHADKVSDDRLLTLALEEPTAIEFVAGMASDNPPTSSQAYGEDATKGIYPTLYNWDTRWGYVTYGNSVLGVTGSGPTCFSMAYMGLVGKNDKTPADFAAMATQSGKTSETYGTTAAFFTETAETVGLKATEFTPAGEDLNDVLDSGVVVLAQVKEGTFGERGHWVLAVSENLDGSINLYDPSSTSNTAHPWDPDTVAGCSETFISLRQAEAETSETSE